MTTPPQHNPDIAKKILRVRAIQWFVQSIVGIAVFGLIARETSWGIWLLIAWCLVITANAVFLWRRLRSAPPTEKS